MSEQVDLIDAELAANALVRDGYEVPHDLDSMMEIVFGGHQPGEDVVRHYDEAWARIRTGERMVAESDAVWARIRAGDEAIADDELLQEDHGGTTCSCVHCERVVGEQWRDVIALHEQGVYAQVSTRWAAAIEQALRAAGQVEHPPARRGQRTTFAILDETAQWTSHTDEFRQRFLLGWQASNSVQREGNEWMRGDMSS